MSLFPWATPGDLNGGALGDVLLGVNAIHDDDNPSKVFEECVMPQACKCQLHNITIVK